MIKFVLFESLFHGKGLSHFVSDGAQHSLRESAKAALARTNPSYSPRAPEFAFYLLGCPDRLEPSTPPRSLPKGALVVLYEDDVPMLMGQLHHAFSAWIDAALEFYDRTKTVPSMFSPPPSPWGFYDNNVSLADLQKVSRVRGGFLDTLKESADARATALGYFREGSQGSFEALLLDSSEPDEGADFQGTASHLCVTADFRPMAAFHWAAPSVAWAVVKTDLFAGATDRRRKTAALRRARNHVVDVSKGGKRSCGVLAHCQCCGGGKFVHVVSEEGSERLRASAVDRCSVLSEHYVGKVRVQPFRVPLGDGRPPLRWARVVYDGLGTLALPTRRRRLTGVFRESVLQFGARAEWIGKAFRVRQGKFGPGGEPCGVGITVERGTPLHPCTRSLDLERVVHVTRAAQGRDGRVQGVRHVGLGENTLYTYLGAFDAEGRETKGALCIMKPGHGKVVFDGNVVHGAGDVAFRGKAVAVDGSLFAAGEFNVFFEPEGRCFVRDGARRFRGEFRKGSLVRGTVRGKAWSLHGEFLPLKDRSEWPGKPGLARGVAESSTATARGEFATRAGKNVLATGLVLDRATGTVARVRRGRLEWGAQARRIQGWWRRRREARRERFREAYGAWLRGLRASREIEVQFAACTLQDWWLSRRRRPLCPGSPNSVAAVPALADMARAKADRERLERIQRRLRERNRARVRQVDACSTKARRRDLARLHRRQCLGVRRALVRQCKACAAGGECAHLREVMALGDEAFDRFWFGHRADL